MKRIFGISILTLSILFPFSCKNEEIKDIKVSTHLILNDILFKDTFMTKEYILPNGIFTEDILYDAYINQYTDDGQGYCLGNASLYLNSELTKKVDLNHQFRKDSDVYLSFNLPFKDITAPVLGGTDVTYYGVSIMKDDDILNKDGCYYLCALKTVRKLNKDEVTYEDCVFFYKDYQKLYHSTKEALKSESPSTDVTPFTNDQYHFIDADNKEVSFPINLSKIKDYYSFAICKKSVNEYLPTVITTGL